MSVPLMGGEDAPHEPDKLVTLAHGFPGSGKTTFACTGPSPLWVFNLDRPATPIFRQLPKHYRINYEPVSVDVDGISQATAQQVLLKFNALLGEALRVNEGTFIVDGYDLFWEVVKLAKLPQRSGDDQALPREFADANAYMAQHLRRLGMSGLQVVLTSLSQHIWEGAQKETRKVQPGGFKHKGRYLTHEVYLYTPEKRYEPAEIPSEAKGQTHSAYISVSKINESLVGSVFPNLTFGMLYRSAYGKPHPQNAELWSLWKKPEVPA